MVPQKLSNLKYVMDIRKSNDCHFESNLQSEICAAGKANQWLEYVNRILPNLSA